MKDFNNKVVVITGAGSGIGRALAIEFSKLGAQLALNDYNQKALLETVEFLNNDSVFYDVFDVSNRNSVFGFAEKVTSRYDVVDVVVNNAGIAMNGEGFEEIDLDKFERVMQVNFNGALYGSRAFIPYLLKRPEASLVNIASVYGLTGIAWGEAYVASKFAVNGLTQSLSQTYKETNLSVHCVYPGGIKTNITKNSIDYTKEADVFDELFLIHTPEFAAKTIVKGIRKNKKRIIIGYDGKMIEYLSRLAPVRGCNLVNNKLKPARDAYKKTMQAK